MPVDDRTDSGGADARVRQLFIPDDRTGGGVCWSTPAGVVTVAGGALAVLLVVPTTVALTLPDGSASTAR